MAVYRGVPAEEDPGNVVSLIGAGLERERRDGKERERERDKKCVRFYF
jgi:hypothetical protein